MGRDTSTNNYWFVIAQPKKISVLQVVLSEEDAYDQNGKPSNPPSHIRLCNCKTSQSPGTQLLNSNNFHPKIWIVIYYSNLPSLICLEILSSCHIISSPIKLGIRHSSATLEIGHCNNPKDPYQKTDKQWPFTGKVGPRHATKMFGSCPIKVR